MSTAPDPCLVPESEFDDEPTGVVIRPWTAVHSQRGKFIHMSHNGTDTLCGVRLRTMVASEQEVDCLQCHNALTFN